MTSEDIVDLTQSPYSFPVNMHLFGLLGNVWLTSPSRWASLSFRDGTDKIFSFNVTTLDILNEQSYSAILEDDSYVRISNGLSVKFEGQDAATTLAGGYVMAIYQ
tara:strand:- start:2143 stop:2457 length:315 start_codon:yes stop_codon:yes gene_type:complete